MLSSRTSHDSDPRSSGVLSTAHSTERIVPSAPPPPGTPSTSSKHHHHHHGSHGTSSGKTRERHKTMLVRQSASFFKNAPPPPKEEDLKPVEPPKPIFDSKRAIMMNAIMMWSKNLSRSKVLVISQAFNKWKYTGMNSSSEPIESEVKKEKIGEQKNSYLLLFKENEKLREQLNESRKSAMVNERAVRGKAIIGMIKIIIRSRMTAKQRYYYDIWLNNTRTMQLISATNQRSVELEVGLLRIDSERNYVQKTEQLNAKLKLTLSMCVYFYQWKGRASLCTLQEERGMYEKQRKLIFNELIRIRKIVSNANRREIAVMHQALQRGEEMSESLGSLKEQLAKAAKLGKSTTPGFTSSSGGAQGAGEDGAHNDNASVITSATRRAKTDHSNTNNNNNSSSSSNNNANNTNSSGRHGIAATA